MAFKTGDEARHTEHGDVVVQAVKDDGTYGVVTKDHKHAFDAAEGDLSPSPAALKLKAKLKAEADEAAAPAMMLKHKREAALKAEKAAEHRAQRRALKSKKAMKYSK